MLSLCINPTNHRWFLSILVASSLNPFVIFKFDNGLLKSIKSVRLREVFSTNCNSSTVETCFFEFNSREKFIRGWCECWFAFKWPFTILFTDEYRWTVDFRRLTQNEANALFQNERISIRKTRKSSHDFFQIIVEVFTIDQVPYTFQFFNTTGQLCYTWINMSIWEYQSFHSKTY